MEFENAVIFWGKNGAPLVTVVGHEITSERLIEIFDNQTVREAIEESSGHMVDNTSEELATVELKS
jgi:hypothetical protein